MKCRLPRKKALMTPSTTIVVNLTLSGRLDSSYGYMIIDGTKYSSAQTITAEIGTEVTVFCSSAVSSNRKNCTITKDSNIVASGTSADGAAYTWVLTGAANISILRSGSSSSRYYWTATITTG